MLMTSSTATLGEGDEGGGKVGEGGLTKGRGGGEKVKNHRVPATATEHAKGGCHRAARHGPPSLGPKETS